MAQHFPIYEDYMNPPAVYKKLIFFDVKLGNFSDIVVVSLVNFVFPIFDLL